MTLAANDNAQQTPSSATDRLLRLLRALGLIGFLGGLAALSAMWAFGPIPQNLEQWHLLIGHVRAVFYTCAFTGIIILVITGITSWLRHRRRLHGARWFRLMLVLLLIVVPASHLSARLTALKLYATIDAGRLDEAARIWHTLGLIYVSSLLALLIIAAIAYLRPRLGQRDRGS
ncbi:MAG: hypothetical protein L0Y44_11290 [Phycisphaerales bacterium]|nr:hypothetical protein [Phycisphaerales bacterium]MCI0676125.1 hypothetical protein [Phycisphaerales bacterium]